MSDSNQTEGHEAATAGRAPPSSARVTGRDNLVRLGGERKSAELSAENSYPLTADEYFILAAKPDEKGTLSAAQLILLSLSLPWICSAVVSIFTLEFSKNGSVIWSNVVVLILYWVAGLGCLIAFLSLLASRSKSDAEAEPYGRLDEKIRRHLEIERRQR